MTQEAIGHFEKALAYDANNAKAAEHLERARRVAADNMAKSRKTGCFVVTAACGNHLAAEVVLLTEFRDKMLSRSWIGRLCIRAYYRVAPHIAAFVSESRWRRNVCRMLIVAPAVCVVRRLRF
jgi:hypothetical protein